MTQAALAIDEPAEKSITTPELEDLLASKYPRDRYALFFNVPDAVGTDSYRRIDAVAVGLWRSVARQVNGFELKVSRSDWLREVKNVEKADPFIERCDYFWLVTASPSIAKMDEIPACWGWMAATKTGLRVQRPASKLPQPNDGRMDRLFAIGLFRKMQEDLKNLPEVRQAIDAARAGKEEEIERQVKYATQRLENRASDAAKAVERFEKSSGMKLDDWRLGDVGKIAKYLHELDSWNSLEKRLEGELRICSEYLENIRHAMAALAEIQGRPASTESSDAQ